MVSDMYKRGFDYKPKKIKTGYMRYCPFPVADKSVVGKSVQVKYFDIAEDNDKYVSSDFNIANILAVGAYDVLRPTCISRMSDLSVADSFENFNVTENV